MRTFKKFFRWWSGLPPISDAARFNSRTMRINYTSVLALFFAVTYELPLLVVGERLNNDIVKNWSALVESYLLKLAEEGLKTRELQKLYDNANYTVEEKSGFDTVNSVKSRLGNYFVKKENAARVSKNNFFNCGMENLISELLIWSSLPKPTVMIMKYSAKMPKSVTIVVFVLHICLDYLCVDVRFVIFSYCCYFRR